MKVTQSHLTLCNPTWNSPGQNIGVGSPSLLQEIFQTQGSNRGLLHRGRILYQLSHKGSRRILEWVTYPFYRRSSPPRNRTVVSCIAGRQILYQLSYERNIFRDLQKYLEPGRCTLQHWDSTHSHCHRDKFSQQAHPAVIRFVPLGTEKG